MFDFISRETLIMVLSFLGTVSVIFAISLPFLQTDKRKERLKSLGKHQEQLSEQLRTEIAERRARARTETKVSLMKKSLQSFRLETLTANPKIRSKLSSAGWRDRSAVITYVFARFALAALFPVFTVVILSLAAVEVQATTKVIMIFGAIVVGYYLPNIYVKNMATKRKQELGLFFPEALDLLGICVNAGQSIEAAFHRVANEIFDDSPVMSEEIGLTAAELAYLGDRTSAYRNFATRTDMPAAKTLSTSLSQSEKYGTPLSQALNVLSDENRKERLSKLEMKAASLPAKLTVPMILFFLPVLFVVILGPAAITMIQR